MTIESLGLVGDDSLIEELDLKPKKTRSKYRLIVDNVVRYFEDHPDRKVTKITCHYGADADNISKQVRNWQTPEENFLVFKRGNVVYFLRNIDGS